MKHKRNSTVQLGLAPDHSRNWHAEADAFLAQMNMASCRSTVAAGKSNTRADTAGGVAANRCWYRSLMLLHVVELRSQSK